jgi:transcriptional regulatory protein RtcR
MAKPLVAIGILGSSLDAAGRDARWDRWRPTICLCQQPDLVISRLELLYTRKYTGLMHQVAADIKSVSPETSVNPVVFELPDAWDFEGVYTLLHDYAKAYPFKPDEEDYLVHITTGTHVAQICLYLLTESRHIPGRLAQTGPKPGVGLRGGDPTGEVRIIDLDLARYDKIAARYAREKRDSIAGLKSGIATRNPKFNQLIDELEHVAGVTTDPILMMGPTGAGKSSLARRVYELKKHRHQLAGEFVEVNCATLRGDTAMSALFGHRKGAFTGAAADRPGLLKTADGGVLFLDEIGELKPDEQAMLLRALEEKRFLPVGSDTETYSNFMLIAGTNRDLRAGVRAGWFREDLLARINLWTFVLPALRERPEDVEPNIEYELERFASKHNRVVRMNAEARAMYNDFAAAPSAVWPGNFRDLSASITRLATLAQGSRITAPDVQREINRLCSEWGGSLAMTQVRGGSADSTFTDTPQSPQSAQAISRAPHAGVQDAIIGRYIGPEMPLDAFDRVQLTEVLRVCERSRSLSQAGRELFSVSRTRRTSTNDSDRVRKYLAKFGISWEQVELARSQTESLR